MSPQFERLCMASSKDLFSIQIWGLQKTFQNIDMMFTKEHHFETIHDVFKGITSVSKFRRRFRKRTTNFQDVDVASTNQICRISSESQKQDLTSMKEVQNKKI